MIGQPLIGSNDHRPIRALDAVGPELPLERADGSAITRGSRAAKDDAFPFGALSDIAEVESRRKEIKPTHIHKWRTLRPGTVFRAVVTGAFAPKGANLLETNSAAACFDKRKRDAPDTHGRRYDVRSSITSSMTGKRSMTASVPTS